MCLRTIISILMTFKIGHISLILTKNVLMFGGTVCRTYSTERTHLMFQLSLPSTSAPTRWSIVCTPLIISVACYAFRYVSFHWLDLSLCTHNYHSIMIIWTLNLTSLVLVAPLLIADCGTPLSLTLLYARSRQCLGSIGLTHLDYAILVSWYPDKNGFYVVGQRLTQRAGRVRLPSRAVNGSAEIRRHSWYGPIHGYGLSNLNSLVSFRKFQYDIRLQIWFYLSLIDANSKFDLESDLTFRRNFAYHL